MELLTYGIDWTLESLVSKLVRGNIGLNQGKDTWDIERKSCFIESLILGLPVPPFVLAEKIKKDYILLDGNQRLLTILQFYNKSESENNNFRLKNIVFLPELNGKRYEDIKNDSLCRDTLTALDNQPIRVIIMRIRSFSVQSFQG